MKEPTPTADDPALEELISQVADDFLERRARGERPDAEEYARRHPAAAAALRRLLPALAALGRAGAEPAPLPPGPAGYALLGELGRGGMGVVYRARQLSLGRVVALKKIRAGALADADERDRFRREAEAAARLRHANVVQVYEVGEHDGLPYLALEYCPGGSLADALGGTPLAADAAARLTETLALAIEAAHRERVVHRDLKPANILLASGATQPGRDGDVAVVAPPAGPDREAWFLSVVPKVADFGLAKRLDESGATQSGAILGTPGYVAPEQASGNSKAVGPAADVYALGAILYEMLTGRPPFQAATPMETLLQVLEKEPVAPRQLQPKVPRDLETICLKCLEKDPRKRYAGAAALADDLRRFREGLPVAARPVGAAARLARWARRRPAAALAYGLTLLVVVFGGLGGGAAWLWRQAESALAGEQAARTDADNQKRRAEELRTQAEQAEQQATTAQRNEMGLRKALAHVSALHQVSLAHREWSENEIVRVGQLLEGCPEEHRHWEWRFVKRLCGAWLLSLPAPAYYTSAVFSPDGQRLAVAATGVDVYDVRSGQGLLTVKGLLRDRGQGTVVFSPDGQRLALAGNSALTVVDAGTGKKVLAIKTGYLICLVWSPDGKLLAGGGTEGPVRLWDAATGRETATLKVREGFITSLSFSPDGKRLAGNTGKEVIVWDVATGRRALPLEEENVGIFLNLAFSPDGRYLGASLADGLKVWDARTGRLIRVIDSGAVDGVNLAFGPDGRLASAGAGGTVRVWDVTTGQESLVLRGHTAGVHWVAFSPDGARLASVSLDGTLKVWDTRRDQEGATWGGKRHDNKITNLALSPDGRHVATCNRISVEGRIIGTEVWVRDARDGREVRLLKEGAGGPPLFGPAQDEVIDTIHGPLAFTPDGKHLAVARHPRGAPQEGHVKFLDVVTGREALRLSTHPVCLSLAFSPDGKRLAGGGSGGTVQVWDLETRQVILDVRAQGLAGRRNLVAFSPDGMRVALSASAAPGEEGARPVTVTVWDVRTGRELLTRPAGAGGVVALSFNAGGRRLASASGDFTLKEWDVDTGEETLSLKGDAPELVGGAFSPDGRRLAGGGTKLTVWDVETGREALSLKGPVNGVTAVAFSADGNHIAASGAEAVKVWDAAAPTAAAAK
jgi:WD40 repeat protein